MVNLTIGQFRNRFSVNPCYVCKIEKKTVVVVANPHGDLQMEGPE